jgi:spoIIIJ-associated protein
MNNNRTTLEMIASTTEEAILNGLAELGLSRDAVEIEVLDEGSRGLFGLGSRHARVRLTVKTADELAPTASALPEQEPPKPAPFITLPPEPAPVGDRTLMVARDTIFELLEKMGIQAEVTAHYGEPEEGRSHVPVLVNIHGNDLSILIGRRAETLNALQFIGNLMVGKELGHAVTMLLDVEGYRERRQNQIRQLARRMADQAIKTGRRQVLEPMPANERRIVHIELRGNPSVRTESTGEDPHRKVVIIPEE